MTADGATDRRAIPEVAVLLLIGVCVGLGLVTIAFLRTKGQVGVFFNRGDARMYWLTAHDLFGTGRGFAAIGRASEVPYRYGRVGLPFLAWVLAFGHPQLVGSTMIIVNVIALAAVPALAAVLIGDYGGNPRCAVIVLLVPGLLALSINVVAEPLLIATILLAYVLDRRERIVASRCTMAFAILVKEIAVLALLPWLWRSVRQRDWAALRGLAATLVPYATWCMWLRYRVGQVPFLTRTVSRRDAFDFPFAGIRKVAALHTPDYKATLAMVMATVIVGAYAAWVARRTPLGVLAAAYTMLTICLGVQALRFEGETMRLLTVPQVFAVIALTAALSETNRPARRQRTRH